MKQKSKTKICNDSLKKDHIEEESIKYKGPNYSREFKCECGISVRLEGDIAKDNRITKCSVCRSK